MLPAAQEKGKDEFKKEEDALKKDQTPIFVLSTLFTMGYFVWIVWRMWKEKKADKSYRAVSSNEVCRSMAFRTNR